MKKYIDIISKILAGSYVTPQAEIKSNGKIDFQLHNVDNKVTITFGANKPQAIAKYIIRVKVDIDSVTFDGDYMYVKPVGWPSISINLTDLEKMA
jgi:hypothetical protein